MVVVPTFSYYERALMIVAIGEILFDIFPQYRRLGGAPFNFVFHIKNLGIPSRLITRVGKDPEAEEILQVLHKFNFDTNDAQQDQDSPTGKVLVELDQKGVPSFDIVNNVAYDNIHFDKNLAKILQEDQLELIYFGSLMQRSENGFRFMQKIFDLKSPEIKLLYDANLRPNCYNKRIIDQSLKHSNVVKLNVEELQIIQELQNFQGSSRDFIDFMIHKNQLDMVCVTNGANGSELFRYDGSSDDAELQPQDNIIDTVGAGDAYTAILAIGYLNDWPSQKILTIATQLASQICTIAGAIPQDNDFYQNITEMIQPVNNL